jgi:TrmH family RNA methyltransferase
MFPKPVVIRSRENATVKLLTGLVHSSRERKKTGLTVLDGAHLVDAYLRTGQCPHLVIVAESAADSADAQQIRQQLLRSQLAVTLAADLLVAEASQLESPATVMAIVATPTASPIPVDASAVLVLDGVQDPGNVGAMLRCAAAFGIQHVLLGAGTAFAWSPKALRAAQGAHFVLNIFERASVLDFVSTYNGQTLALVPDANVHGAQTLAQIDLKRPSAILIGNEGAGLPEAVIAAASIRATIPMPGTIESLNAASCGAIAMYELCHQRNSLSGVR